MDEASAILEGIILLRVLCGMAAAAALALVLLFFSFGGGAVLYYLGGTR